MTVCAVLLFAGNSSRMGQNKLLLTLGGQTVLERCFDAFAQCGEVDSLVLVTSDATRALAGSLQKLYPQKQITLTSGAQTRQQSVQCGLQCATGEIVLIHDGARCFVSQKIICDCIESVRQHGSGIAAIQAVDTVWQASDCAQQPPHSLKREHTYLAQTPQAFYIEQILQAYAQAKAQGLDATDDASVFAALGKPIAFVQGSAENFKITHPADLVRAKALLEKTPCLRVGMGADFHRLVPDRPLMLGGVEVAHSKGLLGHSDADVLLHALCDALLGALALGDIGTHFADTDAQYRNIRSIVLLKRTYALVTQKGYCLQNADMTVCAQTPKLAPYSNAMREAIAHALCVPVDCISVKATTTETMGFVGRGEGMEARAVVLLTKIT